MMPFFDFFHNMFRNHHGGYGRPPEYGADSNFGSENSNTPHIRPEDDVIREFFPMMDFKFMTDPIEMHQMFEQVINQMMQSLTPHESLPGFEGFGMFESPDVPVISEKQDPRDHYLKPGAKLAPPSEEKGNVYKSGPITSWLDKFVPSPDQDDSTKTPNVFSSFRMVSRKIVTLPDGTVKTEEIIRNSDGSEERTESHTKPDGSSDPPLGSPVDPGIINLPKLYGDPVFGLGKMPENQDPRYQYLKPGYEKFNPNSKKIDKDLDKHIEEAGIESLPPLTKDLGIIQPNINGAFKSFQRRIVTLPNGVVESEEVVRNTDGTEERTVTHTWPDGTSKHLTVSEMPYTATIQKNPTDRHDSLLSAAMLGVQDFISFLFK